MLTYMMISRSTDEFEDPQAVGKGWRKLEKVRAGKQRPRVASSQSAIDSEWLESDCLSETRWAPGSRRACPTVSDDWQSRAHFLCKWPGTTSGSPGGELQVKKPALPRRHDTQQTQHLINPGMVLLAATVN